MHKWFAIFLYGALLVILYKFIEKAFLTPPFIATKTLRYQEKYFCR